MTVRRTFQTLTAALLTTFGLVAVAQPGVAAAGESGNFNITGVASLDGKGLSGVTAHLMQSWSEGDSYDHLHNATTNSKGAYSFSKIPYAKYGDPYSYVIVFTDSANRIVTADRYVAAKAGKTVTRDATLKRAATVTGTLSRADGAAPHDISVFWGSKPDPASEEPNGLEVYDARTAVHVHSSGAFTFTGLPAGTQHVQFSDDTGKYLDQCYDNVLAKYNSDGIDPICYQAPGETKVTAVSGQTTTLNPQTMGHLANHISGTVKDPDGNALKGIDVRPVPSASDNLETLDLTTTSDTTGNYDVAGLTPGEWWLRAQDPANIWAPQWFDRKSTSDGATVFDLGESDATGVTITMLSRSILKATATAGTKSATFDVLTTRKAGGPRPGGSVTVNQGSKTATGDLVNGRATIKLTGLTPGKRTITVTYSGNSSTAGTSKTVVVMVKS